MVDFSEEFIGTGSSLREYYIPKS